MIVVSDATPLIALAKIGQLRLLQELFGGILIPRMVYDEVVTNSSGRPGADEIRLAEWITPFARLPIKAGWLTCAMIWMQARRKHWCWQMN